MNKDDYIELFESLGFYCQDGNGNRLPVAHAYQAGRKLRHDDGHVPTVYFNGNEDGVYFVVRIEEWRHFPADLWDEIDQQEASRQLRNYLKTDRRRFRRNHNSAHASCTSPR